MIYLDQDLVSEAIFKRIRTIIDARIKGLWCDLLKILE